MPAGPTTGSNSTQTARPVMSEGGNTATHVHCVSSVKLYCSEPHTTQITRPSQPGTTESGLASALGQTNTLYALHQASTELGLSDDCHKPTGTTENYSKASPRLRGRLAELTRGRHRSSYYPAMMTITTTTAMMPDRVLPNRPRRLLRLRTRLRNSLRHNRLLGLRVANYRLIRDQPLCQWTLLRPRLRRLDPENLLWQAALTITRSDTLHHR